MQYCTNCGKQIDEKAVVCPNCGVAVSNNSNAISAVEDTGNWGWAVLGFCIPIAGLVLYLVWKDSKPLSAKRAGIGALALVITYVLLMILSILIGMVSSSY